MTKTATNILDTTSGESGEFARGLLFARYRSAAIVMLSAYLDIPAGIKDAIPPNQ
jgi:hypothetical protein